MSAQPVPRSEAALVSGEAVALDVRVARAGSRVVALLLDVTVQALTLIFLLPLALLGIETAVPFADSALVRGTTLVCFVLVLVGYPVAFETLSGGRTPGKIALGLRVVRDDGGPIRFRHALTRSLVAVAVEWPGLVLPLFTWVASLTTMLAHPRGKRLGDLAAGTIVIHDRTPAAWGWVPGMPPALAGWATALDLAALDDDLALAVRHFLARGHALAEPERSRLGQALAAEVAAATTPPLPPGVPGWAYLAAVLAERHRRAAHRLARARTVSTRLWPDISTPADRARAAATFEAPQTAAGPLWGAPAAWGAAATSAPAAWGAAATSAPAAWGAAAGSGGPGGAAGPGGAWDTAMPAWGAATDPARARMPAPVDPGEDWPSHTWPEPPWRAPMAHEGAEPDWTGMRTPWVASALRPPIPRDDR